MERIWNEREKQIERVLANTAGMYGEVRGILGSTLPPIPALELDAVAGRLADATADIVDDPHTRGFSRPRKLSLSATAPASSRSHCERSEAISMLETLRGEDCRGACRRLAMTKAGRGFHPSRVGEAGGRLEKISCFDPSRFS